MIPALIKQAVLEHKNNNLYRDFIVSRKIPSEPEKILVNDKKIINFCSNDYLRLSLNGNVVKAMQDGITQYGVGSGGTRNISGTTEAHDTLEKSISNLHNKESSLIFSSAYNANVGSLFVLGSKIPNVAFFSDAENHASIIHGISLSKASKFIYHHNDLYHLEKLLQENNNFLPIIVCESVYSMSGTKTDLNKIAQIAKKYNALTYIDEVHAVGLYGNAGGVSSEQNTEIDIINGTFAKAFGCIGGYISSSQEICDLVKSFAGTFIFSTSLPPAICLACVQAIKEAKSPILQENFWNNINTFKALLLKYNIKSVNTESHIISIPIPTVERVKFIAKTLLEDFNIYVQPIFHPTVAHGKEMLRITVSPHHSKEQMEYFINILSKYNIQSITLKV